MTIFGSFKMKQNIESQHVHTAYFRRKNVFIVNKHKTAEECWLESFIPTGESFMWKCLSDGLEGDVVIWF